MFLSLNKPRLPGYTYRPKLIKTGLHLAVKSPTLKCAVHRRAGRGVFGNKTVFSKGRTTDRLYYNLRFFPTKGFFSLGLITAVSVIMPYKGLAALVRSAVGA